MKIAVFENEYDSVKGAFETANLLNFEGSLDITVFPSSQKANLNLIKEYAVIFIDIDLSSKSELDGFALLKKIQTMDESLTNRTIILTGNNKIKEALKLRDINPDLISIIIKPTDYEEITKYISKITKPN